MWHKKKNREIITTHELADFILRTGSVPTPAYSMDQEKNDFIIPRGIIFAKFRKILRLKA